MRTTDKRQWHSVRRPHRETAVVITAALILLAGLVTVVLSPRAERSTVKLPPLALPTPAVPSPPTAGPDPVLDLVHKQLPLRVATANIYQRLSWPRAAADLERLMEANIDVIGLNEITPGRAAEIKGWLGDDKGWHLYAPPTTPTRFRVSNSLLWNDARLRLLDSGSEFGSHSGTRKYAVDSRWITWAKFKIKKSGTNLYFLVTHMDPAVERRGVPRPNATVGANAVYMDRLKSFVPELTKAAKSGSSAGNVVIVGDWNVNALADRRVQAAAMPFVRLEGRGEGPIISNYTALGFSFPPTSPKSRRWIDYIALWSDLPKGNPELSFTKQYSPKGGYSDHNPVIADLVLKYRALRKAESELLPTPLQ